MHILVIGAGGMIGSKLVSRLSAAGELGGRPIARITRYDVAISPPPPASAFAIETYAGDLSAPGEAEKLLAGRPDIVFHLAAVVSGEAEVNFEKGYRINLDGSRLLFEAIRKQGGGYRPRLVFASSMAVFGGPFPEAISDDFAPAPLTSYGTQKAMAELHLADYARRGFLDGIGLRLPTICVRPGKPNLAASGFFSAIIREPLAGRDAVLPVGEEARHWFASPRSAINFLLHGAVIDLTSLGERRSLNLPGVSCTVGEQIAALKRIAGDRIAGLIRRQPDPAIARIVAGWPGNFLPLRAMALGFRAEANFDDIIRVHIDDELGGVLPT